MNRFDCSLILAFAAATLSGPAFGATVSIYGHIDIGGLPQPPTVIFSEPVVVERVRVVREPVYLHVPPGHEKKWSKHCGKYNACGRPVYFVRDEWYQEVYVPRRDKHGRSDDDHGYKQGKGNDKKHDKGHKKDH